MAKTKDIQLSELPEEVTADGLKIYGPASYETQVAILSQYLHTLKGKHDIASGEKRDEILKRYEISSNTNVNRIRRILCGI